MNYFITIVTLIAPFIIYKGMAQERPEWKPELTEVWEPEPQMINPGNSNTPPSDAIVLFNGTDFSEWESVKGGKVQWVNENNIMTVKPKTGSIRTKRSFRDVQLHIEWRTPAKIEGDGQGRGNSGIFLQNRYEIQVLDSYNNRTYSNGQAGSMYKQHAPLVNASRGPGEWQTYDIIYTAPVFSEGGSVKYPAKVTVLHNGVLIQNNIAIKGETKYTGLPEYAEHGKGQIMLQDHSNEVSFRNIWVRELN